MKCIKSVLVLMLVTTVSFAQNYDVTEYRDGSVKIRKDKGHRQDDIKTIAGNRFHSGGFGALSFRGTEFGDETLVMAGVRGGWIINRTLAIGFEGHGIIPTAKFQGIAPNGDAILLGGYGGMFLEPILFSNQIVHITFPIAGGAGWLGYHEDWEDNRFDGPNRIIDEDVFWYIEPGASVEINVARNFRLGLGVTKRFTQDLNLAQTNSDQFENLNYFMTLKFGKF
ncbi:MAG: hypothetical protein AAFX87_00640 [Bacteroidota bacterium]